MLKRLTSVQHPLVKHLVKLRQNRDYRYEQGTIVIEGIKMVGELSKRERLKCVVVQNEELIPKNVHAEEIVLVTPEMMQKISGMQSPEGIVVEMSMPKSASLSGVKKLLVLDGLADPGNMGTLLRSALALGWDGAYVVNGSCDPYNEKALRAARGATFRLPIAQGAWSGLTPLLKNERLKPLLADLEGTPLDAVQLEGGVALVMGNEARGVSEEAKQQCTAVTIPMPGEMESLNVSIAGSIMMYVLGGIKR